MTQFDELDFRAVVTQVAAVPARPEQCFDIWSRLVQSELGIVLRFATEAREYLVLSQRAERAVPLTGRRLEVLERFLLGEERKAIGIDLGLGAPTIAQILKGTFQELGLDCAPFRAPSQLVLLAHGARGAAADGLSLVGVDERGRRYWVLSEELDRPLFKALAPAQRAVLGHLIQGKSYGDIAAERRTAYRTVANQVASACQRLGVSGRSELLQLIASSGQRHRPVERSGRS